MRLKRLFVIQGMNYLVLGRKLGNYMIFNGIHLFSRNEDFGETHQKSHFLLILAI